MNILFVCHGNINRSAAGEIILKKMRPSLNVKSAGVKTKGNVLTAKKMRRALKQMGYEDNQIRSTPIDQEIVDWADKIFYMDEPNKKRLIAKFGKDILKKSQKISVLLGLSKIPDPHFSQGSHMHREVINMLESALKIYCEEYRL